MESKKKKEFTFEEALEKLEGLVKAMEDGDLPLDELVTRFEEGNKLIKLCQQRLQSFELRIQKLKEDQDGFELEDIDRESLI
jgi:exodeoxyribonuclease VII small subunit